MGDVVFSIGQGACSLFELSGGSGICPTQAKTVVVGYVVLAGIALAMLFAAAKLRT